MIHRIYKTVRLFFLFSFIITNASAQSLPDSITKRIDSLFIQWNTTNTPGCAIGIVRNDSLIYAKGYGKANLEWGIPITPETIFDMGSVSKQFTAYCIVLLARQGRLQLDDDIHKYLPWFLPELKEKITIRNLLNHTSGIREAFSLLNIAGRGGGAYTQEDVIKILSRQQALNDKPGVEFRYSGGNFILLAEIVKSITGQSLRRFSDSAIFKPLGMSNTHFNDDYTEIIKDRSDSYRITDSMQYANNILTLSVVGPSNLYTDVNDMSKWVMNFYDHKVGDQQDIDLLTLKGKLNNGKELSYASGIYVETYKDRKLFRHGGAEGGYRTAVMIIPDLKTGFIVFGNNDPGFDADGKAYEIADIITKDIPQKKDALFENEKDSSAAILKDSLSIKKFLGDYISNEGSTHVIFYLKNGMLYNYAYGFDKTTLWGKEDKDTFSVFNWPPIKMVFSIESKDTNLVVITPDETYHFKKFVKDTLQPDNLLETYTGTYYSPELDTKYAIILKDHHLVLTGTLNMHVKDTELTLLGKNDLISNYSDEMGHLLVLRNSNNQR